MPSKKSKTTVSSKTNASKAAVAQTGRTRFLAAAVVMAAALVAISIGFAGYQKYSLPQPVPANASDRQTGLLFLQAEGVKKLVTGSKVEVTLYENSGSNPVNAVQASVRYPAGKLKIVSVSRSGIFPVEAATDTGTPGVVRLARAVKDKDSAVKGAQPVATLQFTISDGTSGAVQLGVDQSASLLVRSTDNRNILPASGTILYRLGQ